MSAPLFFEHLNVGDRWESPARTVTETDVVSFACLTGDCDPLHVDHETARNSHFGQPIAHGLLGLSLVAGLAIQCPRISTRAFVGIKEWEFREPIYFGDTVHVVTEVLEMSPAGRRNGRVLWRKELVNQKGQIVQSGIFESLVANEKIAKRKPPEEA